MCCRPDAPSHSASDPAVAAPGVMKSIGVNGAGPVAAPYLIPGMYQISLEMEGVRPAP
jgi:hypothetical protein